MTPRLSRDAGVVDVVVRRVVLVVVDSVLPLLTLISRAGVPAGDAAEGCLVGVDVVLAGARSSGCDSGGASSTLAGRADTMIASRTSASATTAPPCRYAFCVSLGVGVPVGRGQR